MLKTTITRLYLFCAKLGIKNLGNCFYYTRNIEYPLCFNKLRLEKAMKVLDVGSGNSIFPVYIADSGCCVCASDLDGFVFRIKDISGKRWFKELIASRRLKIEIQDSRRFSYPDNYFDRVCAVSALEHIPDSGDTDSIKEIGRVLKKGGRAFISVEANAIPVEFYVEHKFYYGHPYFREYRKPGQKTALKFAGNYDDLVKDKELYSLGFIRYYDNKAIFDRLVYPSGLSLEEIGYYANKYIPYRMFFDKSRVPAFIPFLSPVVAGLSFKKLSCGGELLTLKTRPAYYSNAVAYIVLKKPE